MNDATRNPDLLSALECVLFMADRSLTAAELGELLDISAPAVRQLLEVLSERYLGLQIVELGGGYELVTKPEYAEYITRLHQPPKLRLSPASIETLAIVAYRQPITRPEIELLRGVSSDSVVKTLLEHGLIDERGHKNTPGQPMLYGTTDKFLKLFGLTGLTALPDLATFVEQAAPVLDGFTATE